MSNLVFVSLTPDILTSMRLNAGILYNKGIRQNTSYPSLLSIHAAPSLPLLETSCHWLFFHSALVSLVTASPFLSNCIMAYRCHQAFVGTLSE